MNSSPATSIDLNVIELDFAERSHQTLVISLTEPDVLIQPDTLPHLELPSTLDLSREVILFGQAPIWLYCHLIERCHRAPWTGCYNAPLGKVVVIHSQLPAPQIGDSIAPLLKTEPGATLLIGGPPDSGKSLLSTALKRAIAKRHSSSRLFLQRANWDGQGNWAYESDPALTDQLVLGFDAKLHWHPEAAKLVPKYFQEQARSVQNLRKVRDLVFVDVGGVPQLEKRPVVDACSHYLIISHSSEAIDSWHTLCAPSLQCLGVIHSKPDAETQMLSQSPHLEFRLGLSPIATGVLPEPLVLAVCQMLGID